MTNESTNKRRVLCKECQQNTWHAILNEAKSEKELSEEDGIWESTKFITLQCMGCDNVCLLLEYFCTENYNPENGEVDIVYSVYPTPTKEERSLIDKYYYLPNDVVAIYRETIQAFNSKLYILTAIGVRTMIEAVSRDQGITDRGIASKINKMIEKNIVTQAGGDLLLMVKEKGNVSAHEIKKHHHDDLSLCIDVLESVLRNLYILPKSAELTRR